MKFKFFPLYVVTKFKLRDKYLCKLEDSEILEFMYNELEKEKYKDIQRTETAINLKGDHSEMLLNMKPIWVATQSIDFGTISIIHRNDKREIVFKYQSTTYLLVTLILGILISIFSGNLQAGIFVFLVTFVLSWIGVFIMQNMTISGCIDKLVYKEY